LCDDADLVCLWCAVYALILVIELESAFVASQCRQSGLGEIVRDLWIYAVCDSVLDIVIVVLDGGERAL